MLMRVLFVLLTLGLVACSTTTPKPTQPVQAKSPLQVEHDRAQKMLKAKGDNDRFEKANAVFKSLCDKAHLASCYEMGLSFRDGRGSWQDLKQSRAYFEKGCNLTHKNACYELGVLLDAGFDIQPVSDKASLAFTKACKLGHAKGCWQHGKRLLAKKQTTQAQQAFEQSCQGNDPNGCWQLALMMDASSANLAQVLKLTDKACKGQVQAACYRLAQRYESGDGVDKDPKQAKRFYGEACSLKTKVACEKAGVVILGRGITRSTKRTFELNRDCVAKKANRCNDLADYYQEARGMPKDYKRAFQLYERACSLGNLDGCFMKAVFLKNNYGKPKDPIATASPLFDALCKKQNYAKACWAMVQITFDKKTITELMDYANRACVLKDTKSCLVWVGYALTNERKQHHALAHKRGTALCAQGEGEACHRIANAHAAGIGVEKSLSNGIGFLQKGCASKYAISCTSLGTIYQDKSFGMIDAEKSKTYHQKGCALKNGQSCFKLGDAIYWSKDPKKDVKKVAGYFKRSCAFGYDVSCVIYAKFLVRGEGVAKDPKAAVKLLHNRCSKNEGIACEELGTWHSTGIVVKKDAKKATGFYQKACKLGLKSSCKLVK